MDLLDMILMFVIVGVILWLINAYVPMEPRMKTIMNVFVVIFMCIWMLRMLGLLDGLRSIRIR